MKFLEIAERRYSCRNYKPKDIDDKLIIEIMKAVQVAPSAVNNQPLEFIIVKSPQNKEKILEAYPRDWLKTAPVIIVACGNHSISWKRNDGKDHLDIDISIAVDHLTLQAAEFGLDTCWVCNFNAELLKHNLKLPGHIEPIVLIPIGYSNDSNDPKQHLLKRKAIDEFIHWEEYKTN